MIKEFNVTNKSTKIKYGITIYIHFGDKTENKLCEAALFLQHTTRNGQDNRSLKITNSI